MAEKKVEQYYSPPPKLGAWEGFTTFMWNSETSQFMGRTASSWAKILLFYTIFYLALAAFFAGLLAVFYQTLDDKVPKWQLSTSLIGNNPGLGFRPMPSDSNVESTLIWYKASNRENYKLWTDKLDEFLEVYKSPLMQAGQNNKKNCDYDRLPQNDETCVIDPNQWTPCIASNDYKYGDSAPCIFLKLNKIYNWYPSFYNDTNHLPEKMPADLKEHIKLEASRNMKYINTVWVSCEGENPADIENIGPIQYLPKRGFPGYFYPFKNQQAYLSPLVAVFFERPKRGVLINIECKAWANNIVHDRTDRRGSVHFELMVD